MKCWPSDEEEHHQGRRRERSPLGATDLSGCGVLALGRLGVLLFVRRQRIERPGDLMLPQQQHEGDALRANAGRQSLRSQYQRPLVGARPGSRSAQDDLALARHLPTSRPMVRAL